MRLLGFILICVVCTPWLTVSAWANGTSEKLTPEIVFHRFPICKFASSQGQWCKSLSASARTTYSPSQFAGSENRFGTTKLVSSISFTDRGFSLVMKDEKWSHNFALERLSSGIFELIWQDYGGIESSYRAESTFKIIYDEQLANFTVVQVESFAYDSVGNKTDHTVKTFDKGQIPFITDQ